MAETARLNLTVDPDIPDLLTILADGERKRGQFLSDLVRAIHAQQLEVTKGDDLEALRLQLLGLSGQVKMSDVRLSKVEQTVAAMIAKG